MVVVQSNQVVQRAEDSYHEEEKEESERETVIEKAANSANVGA